VTTGEGREAGVGEENDTGEVPAFTFANSRRRRQWDLLGTVAPV
jgi:hypothetical protein